MNVVVVGQGYVGLPLAIETARAGHDTIGLDLDPLVVVRLSKGISHVDDISDDEMRAVLDRGYRPSTEAAEDFYIVDLETQPEAGRRQWRIMTTQFGW